MQPQRYLPFIFLAFALLSGAFDAHGQEQAPLWLHPKVEKMPTFHFGPFVRGGNGQLITIDKDGVYTSADEGKTWENWPLAVDIPFVVSHERALTYTREGVLILACMNNAESVWKWNEVTHDADPGTTLPTYAVRSLDEGKTWESPIKQHDEWSGAVRNMIQADDGRVIFTAMRLLNKPGRHAVLTYSSTDQGASWKASNIIDLGGTGHHGGATEATVIALKDQRLWKLIRTNLGVFWQAWSDDGIYWRRMAPTNIPASSSPAQLLRLASGRMLLVWNKPYPEGEKTFPLTGGDMEWSETAVSNFRSELSIALSEDDGVSWTKSVVIARQKDEWLCYPYLFERVPGEVWLSTMEGDVRIVLQESDFVEPK